MIGSLMGAVAGGKGGDMFGKLLGAAKQIKGGKGAKGAKGTKGAKSGGKSGGQNPLEKLAQMLAGKSPQEQVQMIERLMQNLQAKGGGSPQLQQALQGLKSMALQGANGAAAG